MTPDELRKMRKGKPFTQEQLAKAIGKSRMSIFAWEKGAHPIPEDMAEKIVEACIGVPVLKPADAKLTRATVQAYVDMRKDFEHEVIARLWAEKNFVPTPAAQAQIFELFPELKGKA